MHDTVNGRPETAAFDAVLGLSLTVAGLGVTCVKTHGRPRLLPPVLRVGHAWCLDPSIDRDPFVPQHRSFRVDLDLREILGSSWLNVPLKR